MKSGRLNCSETSIDCRSMIFFNRSAVCLMLSLELATAHRFRNPREPGSVARAVRAAAENAISVNWSRRARHFRPQVARAIAPLRPMEPYQLASSLAQTNRLDEAGRMLDSADRLAGPQRLGQNSRLAFQAHAGQ